MLSRRAVLSAVPAALAIAAAPTGVATAASGRRPVATGPGSPAGMDPTVWREYGTPLVPGCQGGPLRGETIAVKDLFSVAGHRIGAGNEAWLAQAEVETTTAPAVAKLLRAGADIAGIARTDEFAYSLAGTNAHYGTPPNPAAPERIPGGSTSGPASAVALGQATIGLGTDTGGSIRIPSSYQGLYGIRPTHGAVPVEGLIPLAPSFDTVGWITRDPATLTAAGKVLLAHTRRARPPRRALVSEELLAVATDEVQAAVAAAIDRWGGAKALPELVPINFDATVLPQWVRWFQTVQGYEAWQAHGDWISQHWDTLNPDVRSRFETASRYSTADRDAAAKALVGARQTINQLLGDDLLLLPSASSVAPTRQEASLGGAVIEEARATTFQLTVTAGISGRCALSIPVPTTGAPVGLTLIGPRHTDTHLLRLATKTQHAGISR